MSLQATNYCCNRRLPDKSLKEDAASVPGNEPKPGKTRILFVDDESSMLQVLKMGMRSMADVWDMEFAGNGEEALERIGRKTFDVVVSDMRMPGINGAQLLSHVLRHHPQTIRIILSGYSDLSDAVNCAGLAHQFLEKPCSLIDLRNCLQRVTLVKSRLTHEKLCQFTAGLTHLPSRPELYLEITDALQSATASAERIAEIAAKDPALTAKLLQLSNSAFFGISREVFSVAEAVQFLGVGVIQSLAMTVPIFSAFDRKKCPALPLDQIWNHSIKTAVLGRRLLHEQKHDAHRAEQAFCAGLLHDIGKIILADSLPVEYATVLDEVRATHTPLIEVEQKHFHATHAEVGAYLLALWGLPIPLVEAVACHHHPRRCSVEELCLAGSVHLANALQYSAAAPPGIVTSPVDTDYLKHVKLDREFEIWHQELWG